MDYGNLAMVKWCEKILTGNSGEVKAIGKELLLGKNMTRHTLFTVLKILTVFSYCFIVVDGGHFAGPIILFLFLGVGDGGLVTTLICAACLLSFFSLLITPYKDERLNKILIQVIILLLFVPIFYVFYEWNWNTYFLISSAIFAASSIALLVVTLKENRKSNASI